MEMLRKLGISLLALLALPGIASSQKWTPLQNQPTFSSPGTLLLLGDGTVMAHDGCAADWWKLTPDQTGSYINGTWQQLASLPSGYAPLYYSSAVLPGGRVIVEGGEYLGSGSNCNPVWTPLGAIYDPDTNQWTSVNPPSGWGSIGDSQSVILNDGRYMQADCCEKVNQALLNAKTLTWTNLTNTGKADRFDEEGWALLPSGEVLTVDAEDAPNSEIYNPKTMTWKSAGSTIVRLEDPNTQEIGPMVLRPDGTVFATGANSNGPGHTAIYNTKTGKWAKGPDFTGSLNCSDAPAALETNGNVVVMTSPGFGPSGAVFFEWDGTKLTKIPGPPNAVNDPSYVGHLLELPTGQLLFSDFSTDVEVFTPKGTYKAAWQPTITSVPSTITHGKTYVVKGTQFGGLSQGGAYGDDFQDATNYALVRITNNATNHVFYAKTHNPSTMAVATGSKPVSTRFDVPAGIETGASSLVVVTNGIPSAAKAVTVN